MRTEKIFFIGTGVLKYLFLSTPQQVNGEFRIFKFVFFVSLLLVCRLPRDSEMSF